LFSRSSLKPLWSFTPAGNIWRLFPASSGELVVEARDQDAKQAKFNALDSTTGIPYWRDLVLDEPWWVGIEDIASDILLLHKFASPDMPQHQGIIAVGLRTGKLLWSNDELTYWFSHGNAVFAHRMMFDKRVASELNLQTGQSMREFGEDFEADLFQKREEAIQSSQNQLQFPEIAVFDRVDPRVAAIMKKELPAMAMQGTVEYARVDNLVLLNYHVPAKEPIGEGPLLDNHLKIINIDDNRVLYSDILAHNARSAVPDSFFVRNGTAYYIKEQKTLTALHLSE
jgi:hypothetical protein